MLGLRSCRSATFINLKTQDTISIHSTFTADFTGRGINGKSSSILITRCTDTHTHTHTHTYTHVVRTAPVRSVKSVLKTAAGGTKGGDAGK